MKYILTLALLVSLSSCAEEPKSPLPVGEKAVRIPNVTTIYKFTFEGHDYLYSYRTSITHSASCKAPEHYDNRW